MKPLKPLCKKCWLIADGTLPSPDKNSPFCQPIVPSKTKHPSEPDSNNGWLSNRIEQGHEYPIQIEESRKSFGCAMEHLKDMASRYESVYEKNYKRLLKYLAKESKNKRMIKARSKLAELNFKRLLNLKYQAPNQLVLNRQIQSMPKVRIILKEPPILDQHVYLLISPSATTAPFTAGPFGATPMPSFEFGLYKNMCLNREEILVLLRGWSHNYKYFDTNLEFFSKNPNVHKFRENFSELTRPVLDFLRDVGFLEENRHGYRSNNTPIAKKRKDRLIKAIKRGRSLNTIIDEWGDLIGGKPLGRTQILSTLKGIKKPKGFYSEK